MPGRLRKWNSQFDDYLHRKAAERGHVIAMARMGASMRERGKLAEAETWYRKAAAGGDRTSMTALGHLLAERGAHEPSAGSTKPRWPATRTGWCI